jgi:ubiquinol-cytochrome c reductase cytochrome b subunit
VSGERLKQIVGWALDRFAVKPIEKSLMDRRVAKGAWYYGDGAALFLLFNVLLVTGAFLALSYSPSLEGAYSSVRYITDNQTLGWFVRGLHYWSAGLMVVMLCFHLFRQILAGGYKSPREGTWLIGVLLFFTVIATSYLGYVLRWDERAIYGLRVSLNLFYRVPLIGESLVLLVQGGPHIGSQTLPRIYAVHVILVPLLLLALVGYHMYLVVVHGITGPTERTRPVAGAEEQRRLYKADAMSEERGETFFPYTAAKSGAFAGVVFLIVLVLTLTLGPGRLYPEANLVEPSFPAEEWWWAWYSSLAALLPPRLATAFYLGFPVVLFLILVSLPFLDRSPRRGLRNRPVAAVLVSVCVIAILSLSSLRLRSPWTAWPSAEPPPVPDGVVLSPQAEQGRQLFAQYGCNSCHAIDGHGPLFAPDLAAMRRVLSHAEFRSVILNPPETIAMPPYEGRLTEDELERIVDFVMHVQITRHR